MAHRNGPRNEITMTAEEKSLMIDPHVRLAAGYAAPDFALPDQDGATVRLADFAGRRVVVYFYTAAMTPGCTTEACDFRDSLAALAATGTAVIGISPDTPAKLARFRDHDHLNFPLLSDAEHTAMKAYGVWGPKLNYGRTYEGVTRSTFVVGPDGTLEQALYNVKATGHVRRLREKLGV